MSCSKRGEAASCTFAQSTSKDDETREDVSRSSEVQLRLQQLERMVTGLMQSSAMNPEVQESTVDDSMIDLEPTSSKISQTPPKGQPNGNITESDYAGATHWTAILENVGT